MVLLSFSNDSHLISLDQSPEQEFDSWKWIDQKRLSNKSLDLKEVIRKVIDEFIPFIPAK